MLHVQGNSRHKRHRCYVRFFFCNFTLEDLQNAPARVCEGGLKAGLARAMDARGELFEAHDMLAFVRAQVLGPMLARNTGHLQRGVRRLEQQGS